MTCSGFSGMPPRLGQLGIAQQKTVRILPVATTVSLKELGNVVVGLPVFVQAIS